MKFALIYISVVLLITDSYINFLTKFQYQFAVLSFWKYRDKIKSQIIKDFNLE